jgi:hypothetical protein
LVLTAVRRVLPGWLCVLALACPWITVTAAMSGVAPDDAVEITETLLGLDPSRHADPLAAMKGWAALYARYRTLAQAGDPVGVRVWLLMAHTAAVKADAATSESFNADLLPTFGRQPRALLDALADNGWLVPVTCYHLGRHFDFEGRAGAGRAEWLVANEARVKAGLPAAAASRCLEQVRLPRRPAP